jgi:hypothetical protein
LIIHDLENNPSAWIEIAIPGNGRVRSLIFPIRALELFIGQEMRMSQGTHGEVSTVTHICTQNIYRVRRLWTQILQSVTSTEMEDLTHPPVHEIDELTPDGGSGGELIEGELMTVVVGLVALAPVLSITLGSTSLRRAANNWRGDY